MNKKYEFQSLLQSSFSTAKMYIGIELETIEKQELRQTLQLTHNAAKRNNKPGFDDFNIHSVNEAVWSFLNKNYGTQIYNHEDATNFLRKKYEDIESFGYDVQSDFFKKEQDRQFHR